MLYLCGHRWHFGNVHPANIFLQATRVHRLLHASPSVPALIWVDVLLFSSLGSGPLEGLGCSVARATAMISGASGRHPRLASESVKRREVKGGWGLVWAWSASVVADPCTMMPVPVRSALVVWECVWMCVCAFCFEITHKRQTGCGSNNTLPTHLIYL